MLIPYIVKRQSGGLGNELGGRFHQQQAMQTSAWLAYIADATPQDRSLITKYLGNKVPNNICLHEAAGTFSVNYPAIQVIHFV